MEACDVRRVTPLDYTTYFYLFIKATQNLFLIFCHQGVKISGSIFFFFPVCVFFFRQTSGGGSLLSFSTGEQAGGDGKAKQIKQKNHLGCCCHFAGDTVREQD